MLYAHTMPTRRLKATMPTEVARHAEDRARALGCSISSLAEAFLRIDMASPVPGLAVQVAKIELRLKGEQAVRGREALKGAREERWAGRGEPPADE